MSRMSGEKITHDTPHISELTFKKNDSVVVSWTTGDDGRLTVLTGYLDPKGIFPRVMPVDIHMDDEARAILDAIGVKNFE